MQKLKKDDPEYYLKKDVRRLWEWKDEILGDGRDFFVPKPKTLMTLQQYLLENIPNLTECSIISNCARLEILCSCEEKEKLRRQQQEQEQELLLARDISDCFITQMNHYENISKQKNTWMKILTQLPINMDQPESVLTTTTTTTTTMKKKTSATTTFDDNDNDIDNDNSSWWNVVVGTEAILTRLCYISAGMASRPSRPDRPVIFRPFSSPGKAARNSVIVPEIEELRQLVSAESSVSCSSSELRTSQIIAKAAYEKGIRPLINDCITKLDDSTGNKNNIEQRIVELRRGAFDFLLLEIGKDEHNNKTSTTSENNGSDYDNEGGHRELRSWLNRRLHRPTVELRSRSQQRHNNSYSSSSGRNNIVTEKDILVVHDCQNDNGKYYDDSDNKSYVEDCLDEIRKELLLEHHRLLSSVD
ncbi:hypothetical protein FRACYDRAFT_242182 [Fragilariopsis cylindrus CCMP1102]|uniref:Uncharacterized protein n=1 Tax=Fragilariopsis cylindrus CCMP1102 TaxID=635003 RepID=A0A1E7F6S7_9STRA|nr:hypothetical protein FRACYDRAFT_242182 [Fragilariopsis cylindrus CCMP1102]|eukprot:OEU13829.1 hypothetical protein FRACYDRAFT_242182 [Fragilariopsis cylindrus CCMP1102]